MSGTRSGPRPTRRNFLRGVGGAALALPFLELLAPRKAVAAEAPLRYVLMFGGQSVGSQSTGLVAPAVEGSLTANPTLGLAPLVDYGVTDVVSLVSGLSIPCKVVTPPGGRPFQFATTTHAVLATGQRFDASLEGRLPAESSDWKASRAISGTTPVPVLAYRAQPTLYRTTSDPRGFNMGCISARIGPSGQLEQVYPIASPRVAYEALFGRFLVPGAADWEDGRRKLALRRSVVDLVAADAQALTQRLGAMDKLRLQRHFDELRSLETQLDAMELPSMAGCVMPDAAAYAIDPPVGAAIDPLADPPTPEQLADYVAAYENVSGYSDEDLRATLLTDLIQMAFACDLSRVSSFMLTYSGSFMNMNPLLGYPSDLHQVTHSAVGDGSLETTLDAVANCAQWHVKHFARLVQKLRDTEDVDGSSVLDNTAMALAFEGGWGFDPESKSRSHPHCTDDMLMLVAGGAGGLNRTPGRHLRAPYAHPAAVLNTMLGAVGSTETLGEVTGRVDALFD